MSTEDISGVGATQPAAQAPVNNVSANGEPFVVGLPGLPAGPIRLRPRARRSSRPPSSAWRAMPTSTRVRLPNAFSRGELLQNSEIDPLADNDDRLIALLSYATQIIIPVIMPAIVLLSESSKKRPFQRYHAVQSLAFAVVFWGLLVLAGIGTAVIQVVPLIGFLIGLMMACIVPLAWFAQAILLLYYGFQAYKGRRFAVPGLTSFLRDQNWL